MTTRAELEEQIIELQATQDTAERLNQVSRDLNAAADEDDMLQALLRPVAESGVMAVTLIYIDLDQAGEPEWLELVATWQAEGSSAVPAGSRFYIPEFPFSYLWMANPDEPQLISDVLTDERIDENSKNMLIQVGSQAMATIPLTQAGLSRERLVERRWVGLITMTWSKAHVFSPQESKILHALISLVGPVVENRRLLARTQEALHKLRKLELAVEQTADGIAVTDLDGKIQFVNPAWAQMHGYSLEETQDKHMSMFHAAEQMQDQAIPFGQRVLEAGVHHGETEHVKKDGATFPAMMTSSLLKDKAGDSIGFVSTALDISERKQVEEQLQQQQDLLENALEALTHPFCIIDAQDYTVKLANSATNIGAATGTVTCHALTHNSDEPCASAEHPCPLEIVKQTRKPFTVEHVHYDRDGNPRQVEVHGYPIFDDAGNVAQMIEYSLDITGQRQAENEREQLQQELIEAQQRAIEELSTPVIPVMDRILVMPLVGSIDSERAKHIMRALLAGIRAHRARVIILDITGVHIIDSGVAAHLDKTIQAARLKGAQVIVTGITDAVAEALVDLGVDWSALHTLSDLQTGLVAALDSLGITLAVTH